jgi:hypothetical protein
MGTPPSGLGSYSSGAKETGALADLLPIIHGDLRVLESVVRLYQAWGKAAKAAEWSRKRDC